jgi:shikimate kinase
LIPRPRRVWLIGSMGAGKSAVGTALAGLLGWPLLDNDAELRRRTGRSVTELAETGWDPLHRSESLQLLSATLEPVPLVAGIAASVGDRPEDLALLRRTGSVVYLRARPAEIAVALSSYLA